jgi:hypothetical protein
VPNTTNLALPYPSLSSAPNVPQDIQALAEAVDSKVGSPAWTPLPIASGFINSTAVAGPVPGYRIVNGRVQVTFWVQRSSGLFTLSTIFTPFAAGALPAAARPATRPILRWGMSQFSNTNPPLVRIEVGTDGSIQLNVTQPSGTAPTWVQADFDYTPLL